MGQMWGLIFGVNNEDLLSDDQEESSSNYKESVDDNEVSDIQCVFSMERDVLCKVDNVSQNCALVSPNCILQKRKYLTLHFKQQHLF